MKVIKPTIWIKTLPAISGRKCTYQWPVIRLVFSEPMGLQDSMRHINSLSMLKTQDEVTWSISAAQHGSIQAV